MITPKGYKVVNGFLWPEGDTDCARVIFKMKEDLNVVLPFVAPDRRGTCIQAGGNCGVFPAELAKHFGRVLTFEPHSQNFTALATNTAHLRNVVRIQAALGKTRGNVDLYLASHELQNFGAWYVQECHDGIAHAAPVLRIDDFEVDSLGLIYLDIEGFEQTALEGAVATIIKHKPVIALEDKGLSKKYGTKQGDVIQYLAAWHDYVVLKKINRDVVLGHAAEFMDIG